MKTIPRNAIDLPNAMGHSLAPRKLWTAIVGVLLAVLVPSPARSWNAIVNTCPWDQGNAIAIDSAGDVSVAGSLAHPIVNSYAFAVMKFSKAEGVQRWRRVFGEGAGIANAVSTDAAGNVVAAGDGGVGGFTVAKLAAADGAVLWSKDIHGTRLTNSNPNVGLAVTVDGAGDVIAGGQLNNVVVSPDFTVVKLRGSDGVELWRYGSAFFGAAQALAVDTAGDVFAAGGIGIVKLRGTDGVPLWSRIENERTDRIALDAAGDVFGVGSYAGGTIVLKLSGATGAELWRAGEGDGVAIGLDGAGDVIAGGFLSGAATATKLDGDDGTQLWQEGIGADLLYALAVDGAGDVAAAGTLAGDLSVAKLDGGDGSELWRRTFDGTAGGDQDNDWASDVAVDAAGDVAAVGVLANAGGGADFAVVKLFGTDGGDFGPRCGNGIVETGEACDDGNLTDGDGCSAICLEQSLPESISGTVSPGGMLTTDTEEADGATPADPIETRVTSPTGGTVSINEESITGPSARFQLLGMDVQITAPPATAAQPLILVFRLDASRVPDGESATTIDVFRNGETVADCTGAPGTASPDPCVSARVLLADGDVEVEVLTSAASRWNLGVRLSAQGVAGKKLSIADNADTTKRKLVFKAKDPNLLMGAPGRGNDPTCAGGGGAALEVYNTAGTGETAVFELPCEHWSVLGRPGGENGYKYKDAESASGPIRLVVIKNRKTIAVVAKGSQIGYTLDEPFQASIAVALTTGISKSYCAHFTAASVFKNQAGRFLAKNAPAPGVCP